MGAWLQLGSDLSCEAYRRTLYQPYLVHSQLNSSDVIAGVTAHINVTVNSINSFLQLVTSSVVAVGLIIGLICIDKLVALAGLFLFGSAYIILIVTVRSELKSNGQKVVAASNKQLKALQEGLGAIRDVLLDNTQLFYLQIYRKADRLQRQLQAKNNFLGSFPRYSLEGLGLVAISLLGGLLVIQKENVQQ